jgi:hypothetical protein
MIDDPVMVDSGAGGTGSSTTKIMHFAYSMPQYFIIDVLYRFPVNFYDYSTSENRLQNAWKENNKCVGIFAATFPSSQRYRQGHDEDERDEEQKMTIYACDRSSLEVHWQPTLEPESRHPVRSSESRRTSTGTRLCGVMISNDRFDRQVTGPGLRPSHQPISGALYTVMSK